MRDYTEYLILSGKTIREALIQLTALGQDAILFIVDAGGALVGSITDGDVRRGLIKGISLDQPVNDIIRFKPRFIRKGEQNLQKVIQYREGNFMVIPILDGADRIVNVINFRHFRSYLPIDAVIMAGGRGNRLAPLTDTIPKPLLKVGDKPIIEYNLDRLSLFGIDDFWVSVNYLGHQIQEHLEATQNKNKQVSFIKENEPLGTIGSISLVENFQHDYILVTNSDILTNIDYEHFFLEFLEQDADLAVVTIPFQVNVPYAVLETENGCVVKLKEKPTYTYYSNAGIYLFKRSCVDLIPKNLFFNATDLMEQLIASGKKVFSYPFIGYWLDIGNPEDYKKAQNDIHHIKF